MSSKRALALSLTLLGLFGCELLSRGPERVEVIDTTAPTPSAPPTDPHPDSRAEVIAQPVPLYENGHVVRQVDALDASHHSHVVVDLGESWTPYLFTERGSVREPAEPHWYRRVYLTLARGEFPEHLDGDRARADKYLELYGIPPTLSLLRTRMRAARDSECIVNLDLGPLAEFDGRAAYQGDSAARRNAERVDQLESFVARLVLRQHVTTVAEIDRAQLSSDERDKLATYERLAPRVLAIRATQERLRCEGILGPRARYVRGALDWPTREAIGEFERRHRIFGWGQLMPDTISALREAPIESEREAVIRVLTERAIHAAGIIEDGSTSRSRDTPRTFLGRDGARHPLPNLVAEVREAVIRAFALETAESTLAFLDSLGELEPNVEKIVAFRGPTLPEYYARDMELSVEIDRGDVWYDFPYDETGREQPQPTERRPHLTIFTTYLGERIPLASFGTTIGGWRSEFIDDLEWWKYKNSPAGPVIWSDIVAAPVWIPPETTPPRELLHRTRRRGSRQPFEINYREMGPSYASAYGLVAAYHRQYREVGGEFRIIGDEGIRTHGSVDYMSIMRRHSHGCHRLHNHIAVRLMSFVLAHRAHRREGEQHINVIRNLEHEDETYEMRLEHGGYVFALERPIRVEVLEGRIRGTLRHPVEIAIPKFNSDVGAYLLPDGSAVAFRHGELVSVPLPLPNADAGIGVPIVGPDGHLIPSPTPPPGTVLAPTPPVVTLPAPPPLPPEPMPR